MCDWAPLVRQRRHFSTGDSTKTSGWLKATRNIGVFAHVDAGKTTTTERMLVHAGEIRAPGSVDEGTTQMDYMKQEQLRGITIRAAATTFAWKGYIVNLVDTPGHVDFTAEVQRAVRVLDGAVVVIDGTAGVQAQTRTIWRQTEHLPRLIFVNKLDREGCTYKMNMSSLNTRLPPSKARPLAIQYPLWKPRGALRAVVDLLTTKAYSFEGKHGRSVVEDTISDDELTEVMEARNELLETLAILDEDFGTAYLDRSEEDPAIVADAVRRQCLQRTISPVVFGSALGNQGIQHLLDAVALYLPNPIDAHVARPEHVPDPTETGVLMEAFKVLPPMGREEKDNSNIVYCRVLSGVLKGRAAVTNQTRKARGKGKLVENIREVFHPKASEIEPCKELRGGEVGVVIGLNNVRSGDILTSGSAEQLKKLSLVIASRMKDAAAHAPSCVCFAPFTTPTLQQDQELIKALDRMMLEDPSIEFRKDKSEQILVWGMGDLHLELCRDRIRDEFNIPVEMGKLHVSKATLTLLNSRSSQVTYREHVAGEVRMSFHDETGGSGVHLDVSLGPARALPNVYGGEIAGEEAYANEVVFSKEIDGGSMKVHNVLREKIEQWLQDSFQSGPRLYAEFAATRVIAVYCPLARRGC
ncbi:translation elongation factor G 2, putative [Perkinsus marinus ATCC 50983]|uniref:Translation elongation factor G 2, putative n=1 Tax=Perkinsus marinus (strain ATCC 50983 / TXsc) TaxID=423536 RepID=C5LF43_PERM5|nr:translation elongation factor G 2, putative [Perkinsus marinus ATCC 50983]EER04627.1 translation elongation factor G 2, putative [Perkinsus marinus ATCC 50983]|eukprot:XP_002772811.1 translation elongation factor G 2, putative [Perkinsus marinus ATCC 50983]